MKMGLSKKNRIWELDFFRGLSILLVVVDHAMYDFGRAYAFWQTSASPFLRNLSNLGLQYLTSDVRFFWRPAFLFIFFFTSGLCTAFSRNNFFRGIRLVIVAASVSIITYYADSLFSTQVFALFGVLHCIAAVILIYALVSFLIRIITKLTAKIGKKPYNAKLERILHIVICLALGVAFCFINSAYNVSISEVTGDYSAIITDSKIMGLFFYCENWWTADYFPLFPYIAFFFLGAGVSRIVYEKKRSLLPVLDGVWHEPFTFPGRYSLIFYLAGQVVTIGLCALLSQIILGTPF